MRRERVGDREAGEHPDRQLIDRDVQKGQGSLVERGQAVQKQQQLEGQLPAAQAAQGPQNLLGQER